MGNPAGNVFLVVLVYVSSPLLVSGLEVTLLDTTKEDTLNWTKYPFGPQSTTPGWIEESFTDFEKGINWRSYVVCDVQFRKVDNWLWTPFIERGPAKRIFIEMKFSVRDCSLYPGETRTCKETFSLLYYEFDVATREPPPWQPDSYVLVDRIAADEGRFSQTSEVIINSEIRSVPVTKKGLYFAFRDQGGCISLLAIRVYYVTCPEIVSNLTVFPSTPTGSELTSVERGDGRCVSNASPSSPDGKLAMMCKGDGSWFYQQGECHCDPGFEPSLDYKSCKECPPGRFKPVSDGGGMCRTCPPHSSAPHSGLSKCRCDDGYYRAPHDPEEMACTRPPSAPQNLTVNFVDQSTVILSWNHPHDSGGRRDTTYKISCDTCGNSVTYVPSRVADGNFNDTKVTIMGLRPVTTYAFKVFAENGVTGLAANYLSKFVDITVTTDARVPSRVTNVRVADVKMAEITVTWDPPPGPVTYIEMYEVRFFARGQEKQAVTTLTKKQIATFRDLRPRTDYGFQVRAKVSHGWGEFSTPMFRTTGQMIAYVEEEPTSKVHVVTVMTIVGVLFVVLAALTVYWFLIRKRRGAEDCNKKPPSDCDTLEYRNGEVPCPAETPPIITTHMTNMTTPLFTHVGTPRTYVDPHTYEDPNQAVKDFAREIDASCITIEAIIGGGEFGEVCKGKLKYPGRPEICVAIKTLKPGSTDKARKDFLTEASIMGQFEHPNVIFLQGVVTKSNPIMIITEYMENGSLDTFLRANDGKFQVVQLVGMLRGISSGMQYLSEMNYVHRDLAARNVLVNAQLVCKIADFGLSREIESAAEGAYTTRGGKIPVRWTAPEAIAYRKFTWASDVWSYGIVMWEVMSFGERPYWNWSNQDVIKAIERGYRLPAPMDCPEAIHQLMLDCWQKDRTNRPAFGSIVMTLDKLLQCPETLRKTTMNRRPPPLNPYYTAPLMLAEDGAWVLYPKTK